MGRCKKKKNALKNEEACAFPGQPSLGLGYFFRREPAEQPADSRAADYHQHQKNIRKE